MLLVCVCVCVFLIIVTFLKLVSLHGHWRNILVSATFTNFLFDSMILTDSIAYGEVER